MPVDPRLYAATTVSVLGKTIEISVWTEPLSPEFGKIRVSELWAAQRPTVTMESYITKQALEKLIAACQALAERLTEEE